MSGPRPLVGNDVVDLRDPRCTGKAEDERFVERVFAPAEAEWIRAADDPDRALWAAWSAKEAAFKVVSKLLGAPPTFHHADFLFQTDGLTSGSPDGSGVPGGGTVAYRGTTLPVRIAAHPDRIHTLAWHPPRADPDAVRVGVKLLPAHGHSHDPEWKKGLGDRFTEREWRSIHRPESALARIGVRGELSTLLDVPEGALEIVCEEGPPGRMPPRVLVEGRPWEGDVSLSHHGRFLAWAYFPGG